MVHGNGKVHGWSWRADKKTCGEKPTSDCKTSVDMSGLVDSLNRCDLFHRRWDRRSGGIGLGCPVFLLRREPIFSGLPELGSKLLENELSAARCRQPMTFYGTARHGAARYGSATLLAPMTPDLTAPKRHAVDYEGHAAVALTVPLRYGTLFSLPDVSVLRASHSRL